VRVDIFHKRFASQQGSLLRITQSLRHRFLHVEMQNVGRAVVQIMQLGSDSQEKIIGCFNPTPVRFAQPVLTDKMGRGQAAFLEESHPKKILIVAQTTAATFQVRFLQVNAVAKFCMACLLIPHSHFDVFTFVTGNAFCPKLRAKFLLQLLVPRNQT
jgi:hypothetical protein